MNKIENIIIHCSMSDFGDAALIKKWHVEDNGWRDIGYNGVILNGYRKKNDFNKNEIGLFEIGRGLNLDQYIDDTEKGAHALGYNHNSVGICLIGNNKFYIEQFQTALYFCALYLAINKDIKIIGHYEVTDKKTCPNFDMSRFRGLLKNRDFMSDDINLALSEYIIND